MNVKEERNLRKHGTSEDDVTSSWLCDLKEPF